MTIEIDNDAYFLQTACAAAEENVHKGGGPFGAVIAKSDCTANDRFFVASNQVTNDNDPTAHAEVNAIRKACKQLGRFDLSGYTLYTSCEPCPMCLCAALWARISRIVYACTREDAAKAGFDDSYFYKQVNLPVGQREIIEKQLDIFDKDKAFHKWNAKEDKTKY